VGEFSYAVCTTPGSDQRLVTGLICTDSNPGRWPEAAELQQLAAEMQRARVTTSAGLRGVAGAWHVVWGDADAAVAELREATHLDPRSAEAQTDLAAALLERAEVKQDPLSLLEACTAADSAIALAPALREARFNRALALEWLHLPNDAIEAWSSYLQLDDTSPWAYEARERLGRLRAPSAGWSSEKERLRAALPAGDEGTVDEIARRFPQRVRQEVSRAVVAWAGAYQAREPGSDTIIRRTIILARALARSTGDSMWLDVVQPLDDASPSARRRRAATARGLIALETARRYLRPERLELDSANVWISDAYRALGSVRSAAIYLAAYDSAQIPYQRHTPEGYDAALAAFRRIRRATPMAYKVVRGLAARSEALIQSIRADREAAIASYIDAIREGEGTGDPGLEVRPRVALASLLPAMRGDREAWKQLYAAFRTSTRYVDELSDARRVAVTAAALSWRTDPRVALKYQAAAVRFARLSADTTSMVGALARQAALLARAGLADAARASVREARLYIARMQSDSIKALYSADVDLVDGEAWLRAKPDSAVRVLSRAVHRYRDTQYLLEVDRALVLLARAYAASGAMDSAQRAFDDAVQEMERRRSGVTGDEDRARFLDQARPVIDTIL
jgi:hypothetical protein